MLTTKATLAPSTNITRSPPGSFVIRTCEDVVNELHWWLLTGIVLPALVNIVIIMLYAWTYCTIRSFRIIADQVVSNTHWLSRTAVRVGLGPTAKTALVDYARKRPELATLINGPAAN